MFVCLFVVLVVVAASLANSAPPLDDREKLYLLAVGYYRSGDCSKSRQLVDRCIQVSSTSLFNTHTESIRSIIKCMIVYIYVLCCIVW